MSDGTEFAVLLEATLHAMLDAMDEGALVFDLEGTCRVAGRRVGELFGKEPAALIGRPRVDVLRELSAQTEDPDLFYAAVAANDLELPPQLHGEHEIERPRHRVVIWSSYPLVIGGKRCGRLALVRDVTRERSAERARTALQRRLDAALPVDPLTGLANRRRFLEELEREHHRATRSWDTYAILLADVDGLGAINESHGHPVGDHVLEEVAIAVKRARREYDVVARLDGDDFALLLPGADVVAAEAVSERVAMSIRELRVGDGVDVSASIGAAVWQPGSRDKGTDVLERAVASLELARSRGSAHLAVEGQVRGLPALSIVPAPGAPPSRR